MLEIVQVLRGPGFNFPTVCNFSPRASNTFFWPLQALYTHIAQTCEAPIHIKMFLKGKTAQPQQRSRYPSSAVQSLTTNPHLPHHSNTWSPTQNSREVSIPILPPSWWSSYPSFHGNHMKVLGPRIPNQFGLPNQLNPFTKMHWNHSVLCS